MAVVVVPTPPFWFAIAMTRPNSFPSGREIYHIINKICKLFHVEQNFHTNFRNLSGPYSLFTSPTIGLRDQADHEDLVSKCSTWNKSVTLIRYGRGEASTVGRPIRINRR